MYNHDLNNSPIFYGRRRGRKLSKSSQTALQNGRKFIIDKEDLEFVFICKNQIILEIGFGDGERSAALISILFWIMM